MLNNNKETKMNDYPSALLLDGYKIYHPFAYKPGCTHVHSNFTCRFNTHSNIPNNAHTVFVGLQYFILEVLVDRWNKTFFNVDKEEAVEEYARVTSAMLGGPIDTTHIGDLHDIGYLPLEIKALPEGSLVPYGVPCLTITNTMEGFGWVTNSIETVLSSELWGICTSATTAYAYRKRFEQSPLPKEGIGFMGHDFSYRGMFGTQAASMSGFGHLCSFFGSDTIPAALFAEKYYGADISGELVFASVPATEHSVMCSYGPEGEIGSLEHLMTEVTPSGILSIVSDTWDFWKLVTEYLPALKDKIMAREGTLVIRPDSGDPVRILCGYQVLPEPAQMHEGSWVYDHEDVVKGDHCVSLVKGEWILFQREYDQGPSIAFYRKKVIIAECEVKGLVECLWDTFGGTVDESTGLKCLDTHIGAIYGDAITLERQDQILNRLEAKGFMPSVVLGIGSYSYQMVTRDTHGSAVKATDLQFGAGNHVPIFKAPKTDTSKTSAKGLLSVTKDENNQYALKQECTPEFEQSEENLLTTVFKNSKLVRRTTLNEIREIINNTF